MDSDPKLDSNATIKLLSFNCKSVMRSVEGIRGLCKYADVIALQETWLLPHDVSYIGTIDKDFDFTSKSAVDTSSGILRGRPYGGVAIMWRKGIFSSVSVIECSSVRIAGIKVTVDDRSLLLFTIYMPTDSAENLPEFINCLSEISAIVESSGVSASIMLGDFNAHPGECFYKELCNFCSDETWVCADTYLLGLDSDAYTFTSESHGCRRWLDHSIVTAAAMQAISHINIEYDCYWSDHLPLQVLFNFKRLVSEINSKSNTLNKIVWGERDARQSTLYASLCSERLRKIDFPEQFTACCDGFCDNVYHRNIINDLYDKIVISLSEAAMLTCSRSGGKKRVVAGWNKYVGEAHRAARVSFLEWVECGKPKDGQLYERMSESRRVFKRKLKWCQDNQNQIKMDILASKHGSKDFKGFWKETKRMNSGVSLPGSVEGVCSVNGIAEIFREHFTVEPSLGCEVIGESEPLRNKGGRVTFTAKDVGQVIKNMSRGKSPGHDSLSVEHLQYAGVHLPRVLSMLFNLCIGHSYLPVDLMRTVVVPILKNKTGDASDKNNYRPISLATVIAKVLDSLIDRRLAQHIKLHDAQFGFRPGLSTESAILCLKHTVKYYTDRKTPVFACFLDLSKAFDLVSYDILWEKLRADTDTPAELIAILKHWYGNQINQVKWNGSLSSSYSMKCGVRQGGMSSPRLFNCYMNGLIEGLSGANVGCSVDGVNFNNISYADDMVLLSPSISGLRKMLAICGEYAESHGLKYNVKKSEFMVFKAKGRSYPETPPVMLNGVALQRTFTFKYLGHWVTDSLRDDADVDRERRALAVRCNMVARRFARSSDSVKITLFKAYCQTFYSCSLWANYTQKALNSLRVQYNNGFRVMFGLPRYCSASGMFADGNTDSFGAILRKRAASLMRRIRGSSNSLVSVIGGKLESPIWKHWMELHVNRMKG